VVCGAPSECCHVRNRRMWGDPGNVWPGCHTHHSEQHDHGIKTFQLKYGLDLAAIAERYGTEWGRLNEPGPVDAAG
jgi:hypothetical protein